MAERKGTKTYQPERDVQQSLLSQHESSASTDRWLTTKEAVAILKSSSRTLDRLRAQGKVHSTLVTSTTGNRRRLYLAKDVDQLLSIKTRPGQVGGEMETRTLTTLVESLENMPKPVRLRVLRYLSARFGLRH